MKFRASLFVLALMALLVAPVVSHGGAPQEQEQRPTLGPPPTPSLNGPTSSTVTNPRRLLRVRAIYVDRIDNNLGVELGQELAASKRFRIVEKMKDADAVLRGTCFDSRHLKTLHSEVYLTDRITGASIWQDDVHERVNPPALKKAVSQTANLIARHLMMSITKAERP